ncbi:MAG: hypothetical protein WKF82_08030, partial [Nocardioidaceae bacterium]
LGVAKGGYYAIESMRARRRRDPPGLRTRADARRYNPVEAGLLFACKLKTDIDFLGRAGVEKKAKSEGARRRLVSFLVEDPERDAAGQRALAASDGQATGQVVSAAWGDELRRMRGSRTSGATTASPSPWTGCAKAPTRSTSTDSCSR